jgi:DNA-binding transcriptional regulator GbsR (MarR family)
VSTRPITVQIAGDDAQLNAVMSRALAQIKLMQAGGQQAGQVMASSFQESRAAAALLGEEVGVRLNRHLRGVLATSELLGPILKVAFYPAVLFGFYEVLSHVKDKIDETALSIGGFGKASQEAYKQIIADNLAMLAQFSTAAEGYRKIAELNKELGAAEAKRDAIAKEMKDYPIAIQNFWKKKDFEAADASVNEIMKTRLKAFNQLTEVQKKANEDAHKDSERRLKDLKQELEAIQKMLALYPAGGMRNLENFNQGLIAGVPSPYGGLTGGGGAMPLYSGTNEAMQTWQLQNDQNTQLENARRIFTETRTAAEQYAEALQGINVLLKAGKLDQDTYNRAAKVLHDRFDETHKALVQMGAAAGEAMKQGMLMGRNWGDVMRSLLVTLAEVIIKMTVLKNLEKSSFGGTFGGQLLGGVLGGFTGGHASGGFMAPGQWGIVGEHGPELAFAGSAGMSISPRGIGGGAVVYNIDARGADVSVEQRIMRVLPLIEERAVRRAVATTQEIQARR